MHRISLLGCKHALRSISTGSAGATINPKDVFGTLSESGKKTLAVQSKDKFIRDDPDGYDKEDFDIEPRKNAYYYKYEITKWARQGSTGIRRALELFQEMKAKARLQPTVENFSPLIYGCAKAGYTKRAFELYKESIKYVRKPTNSTITCLINACAESPFPEYGLKRLDWLLTHLRVNFTNKTFNEIHYNSAIKAYGKLGNLEEASKLIQDMIDNKIYPTSDTFNMLLIGCASNKEAGCSIALRVFKRMKMYDIKPTVVTYRLLLRCIRDCDMGSSDLVKETIRELPAITSLDQRINYNKMNKKNSRNKFSSNFEWAPLITDLGKSISDAIGESKESSSSLQPVKRQNNWVCEINQHERTTAPSLDDLAIVPMASDSIDLPNLLSDDHLSLMHSIEGLRLDKLKEGFGRLMLFGGPKGYLEVMVKDQCEPDNKTFSLLLDCLRPTRENFIEYFKLAQNFNIKRDLLFYDLLIRHVCKNRSDKNRLELALHFVEQMHLDNLRPNITTFESLIGGCTTWAKAEQLISDVKGCGFTISDKMIREMFYIAISLMNFRYLTNLIKLSQEQHFKPTKLLIDKLENCRLAANELILQQEKGIGAPSRTFTENEIKNFDTFKIKFGKWLSQVELQEDDHPWSQFKVQDGSKRDKFMDFVKHFKALEQVKQEALERGNHFGNLSFKASKMAQQA